MSSKKKIVAIAITTVALSLGSVGIATAENSKSSAKSKVSIGKFFNQTTSVNLRGRSMEAHGQNLAAILAGLVAKGTLTQAQVDAINAAIVAARSSDQTQGDAARTAHKTLIATTLGISVATLEARIAAGESLATIAGAKKDALIAALVADATVKIDAAVTAGKITAAQAAQLKANLTVAITAQVNRAGGMWGHDGDMDGRMGGHMGGHMNGGMGNTGVSLTGMTGLSLHR